MKCAKCGETNPDGTRFCRRCGRSVDEAGPRRGFAGMLGALVGLAVVVFVGYQFVAKRPAAPTVVASPGTSAAAPSNPSPQPRGDAKVTVGIAYGTEKEQWLKWAVQQFAATPEGRNIKIDLRPMGSLEGAQAVVRGDKSIQVWSPASGAYKNVFLRDWQARYPNDNPIARESPLALTPMVFVMWDVRYAAFESKYKELTFRTVGQAMAEPEGWKTIANQPDWMFFKFSHTAPNQSNSGVAALLLMSYDYHGKHRDLSGGDITDAKFQDWLLAVERNLVGAASGLVNSTGNLMNAMIQRGWSTYDVVLVYENTAIERLDQALGRWGGLRVVYPKYNLWNDNPYYVLNVPWSTPEQRDAAAKFLDFLLSEPVQRQAMLAHGFRPANTAVATNTPDAPFVKYADHGLKADVPGVFCEPPRAEVIENLLLLWQRAAGAR
jgi:ABC-type Fe3+ transport system substrate-binding protein